MCISWTSIETSITRLGSASLYHYGNRWHKDVASLFLFNLLWSLATCRTALYDNVNIYKCLHFWPQHKAVYIHLESTWHTKTLPGSSKGSKVFWSVFLTYQSNIRPTNGEISVTPASAHATAYITFELHSKHAHTRRQVPTKHYCKWSVTGVQSRGSATIA